MTSSRQTYAGVNLQRCVNHPDRLALQRAVHKGEYAWLCNQCVRTWFAKRGVELKDVLR